MVTAEKCGVVPELARFYGIVVRMYFDEHPPAHFHAYYGEHDAAFRLDTLQVARGSLPSRALRLVVEWALAHEAELRENWRRVETGEPLMPIPPLE